MTWGIIDKRTGNTAVDHTGQILLFTDFADCLACYTRLMVKGSITDTSHAVREVRTNVRIL